jgi:hypothetical protein
MPYDRGGLTILPNFGADASSQLTAFDLDAAAGTEALIAMTMITHGKLWGVCYDVAEVLACDTTDPVVALHINDVEVGTFTIADGTGAGVRGFVAMTPVAGTDPTFEPGDVLKVEIKTRLVDAGTETGQIIVQPVVVLDQA